MARSIAGPFLLRFVLILAVYMIPWPGFGEAYGGAATAIGNGIAGGSVADGRATFHFDVPSKASRDAGTADAYGTELTVRFSANGETARVPIDLRTLAYVPTAVFVALTVAAPIWQSMRGIAVLIGGLAVLHTFLVGSIAIPIVLLFSHADRGGLFDLAPLLERLLTVFYRSTVAPPGMAFAIPGLIWLFLVWTIPDFTLRPRGAATLALSPCPVPTTSEESQVSAPSSAK